MFSNSIYHCMIMSALYQLCFLLGCMSATFSVTHFLFSFASDDYVLSYVKSFMRSLDLHTIEDTDDVMAFREMIDNTFLPGFAVIDLYVDLFMSLSWCFNRLMIRFPRLNSM